MKLSLCMIVKNEEDMLADALRSAEKYVDEMIIVDTGSTDNTIAIAEQFQAKVISFEEEQFSYGNARNIAIRNATSEWILFLDADEILEVKGQSSIKDFLKDASFDACHLWRYNYCPGGGWSGYYMWRIFRNEGFSFHGDMLERPVWAGKPEPLDSQTSDIMIHHMGRLKQETVSIEKTHRYIRSVQKLIAENADSDDLFLYYNMMLNMMYCQNNQRDLALENLKMCRTLKGFGGWLYHRVAGDIYRFCNEHDAALQEYEISLNLSDDRIIKSSIYEIIGLTHAEQGAYQLAYEGIMKAFQLDDKIPHRFINLGLIQILLGDKDQGEEMLAKGLKENPYFSDPRIYLSDEPRDVHWECDIPQIFRTMLKKYVQGQELPVCK